MLARSTGPWFRRRERERREGGGTRALSQLLNFPIPKTFPCQIKGIIVHTTNALPPTRPFDPTNQARAPPLSTSTPVDTPSPGEGILCGFLPFSKESAILQTGVFNRTTTQSFKKGRESGRWATSSASIKALAGLE